MSELLNQKELATVVADAPVTDGYAPLQDAISARYPNADFGLLPRGKVALGNQE